MSAQTQSPPSTVDREIVTTRTIHAPRELVWKAWTDPNHITQWWGPNGFSTTTKEFDLRAGGTWRFTMHGPDGRDYPNRIVYTEVSKPERISYKHAGEDEYADIQFEACVTFEAEGSKTKVTLHSLFATKEELDFVVKEHGALEGAQQTLERLDAFVGRTFVSPMHNVRISLPSDVEARMKRTLSAPRELVFDAWTQPRHITKWMLGPDGWTMPICEVDLRPGGTWRFVWRREDGTEMPMHGVYREIRRPERLVNTEHWGEPWPETINTLLLTDKNGETEISLTILYPSKAARDAAIQTGMKDGAEMSFDRLEMLLVNLKA
jgi:uncharacterized protein YndB with AHSA1/START domain